MKKQLLAALFFTAAAQAEEIQLSIEIPEVDAAEYHLPYVAAWLESSDKKLTEHLLVWYQNDIDGEEWLKDLRRWWRKGGRNVNINELDGIAGATKSIGKHEVNFDADTPIMKQLTDGEYTLYIEAVRENGGREVLKIPFSVPFTTPQQLSADGKTELGAVRLTLIP